MCSNYRPVTRLDRLLTFFGVERAKDQLPPDVDVYPLGLAPFIRLAPGAQPGTGPLVAETAVFGLLPPFATELSFGRRTYNARCETVHRLPSFKHAWTNGWRCIIPAECIYEPSYESGRCEWWRIGQQGDIPLGVAGVYREWLAPDGRRLWSMAMITVNADDHPVMKRFHKPREEKRMVVILEPKDYLAWLTCPVEEAPKFFRQWQGPLVTAPRSARPASLFGDMEDPLAER